MVHSRCVAKAERVAHKSRAAASVSRQESRIKPESEMPCRVVFRAAPKAITERRPVRIPSAVGIVCEPQASSEIRPQLCMWASEQETSPKLKLIDLRVERLAVDAGERISLAERGRIVHPQKFRFKVRCKRII